VTPVTVWHAVCRSFLSVLALLSLLALAPSTPTPPPVRLVVDSSLLVRLQTIAAGLQNEMVLCLTGSVNGAEAVVTGFTIPAPQVSTSDHATVAPCPREAVAIWHNHPLEAPLGSDPNLTPRDLCALSETDIRTTSQGSHFFVVIAIDANTWCWWSRDQVRNMAARHALRGGSVPGQISSFQPTRTATGTRIY
jgi:hypothetical protein